MRSQLGLWGGEVELVARKEIGMLSKRFIVPPFSILDARQGYWQERKRAWLALGIQGELGRGETNCPGSPGDTRSGRQSGKYKGGHAWLSSSRRGENPRPGQLTKAFFRPNQDLPESVQRQLGGYFAKGAVIERAQGATGTSIFDPVLCELAYAWFCPSGGHILDPFAGGSVRGIVAEWLGCQYTGVELRPEQVAANEAQAKEIGVSPHWVVGDAMHIKDLVVGEYDFIFSCPPYYNLEVYSNLEGELSALVSYREFIENYRAIVASSVDLLKNNRLACFVVGDIRDKKGLYRNFVSDTIAAFQDAGAALYNEAILVTAIGSLPIRVGKQFAAGRKLGKTHQNVLVFIKGDWRKATEACSRENLAQELKITRGAAVKQLDIQASSKKADF